MKTYIVNMTEDEMKLFSEFLEQKGVSVWIKKDSNIEDELYKILNSEFYTKITIPEDVTTINKYAF